MNVKIIEPISYCTGVKNAIDKVLEIAKKNPNKQIYLLGKVVNNNEVIRQLANVGIETLNISPSEYEQAIESIKPGSVLIFSAHGHDNKLEDLAKKKDLIFYSTTCKIIENTIKHVLKSLENKHKVIFAGLKNHPETVAFTSLSKNVYLFDVKNMSFESKDINKDDIYDVYCQSTLSETIISSVNLELKKTFKNINIHTKICPTTSARTKVLLDIKVVGSNCIIIIGSKTSSNCSRLYENAKSFYPNKLVLFIENLDELKSLNALHDIKDCVLLSGTSTPPESINEIYDYLRGLL